MKKMKFKRYMITGALACAFAFTTPIWAGCNEPSGDIQVKVADEYVQWSDNNKDWKKLISVEDVKNSLGEIKGEKGDQGDPGQDGRDGQDGQDGRDGRDGQDASAASYTLSFDYSYNDVDVSELFKTTQASQSISSKEWVVSLPEPKDEVKEYFSGWFIKDSNRQIQKYDFIGGNAILETRWNETFAYNCEFDSNNPDTAIINATKSFVIVPAKNGNTTVTKVSGKNQTEGTTLNLEKVILPSTITTINAAAFKDCVNLESIFIPESVTSVGSNAFNGCTNLVRVYITDLAKWCKISFGEFANPLAAVVNESDKKSILYVNDVPTTDIDLTSVNGDLGLRVFSGYKALTSVVVPASMSSIKANAFHLSSSDELESYPKIYYCGSSTLTINESNELLKPENIYYKVDSIDDIADVNGNYWYYGEDEQIQEWKLITDGGIKYMVGSNANVLGVVDDAEITELVIPATIEGKPVTRIMTEAFKDCTTITSVTIPSSVTKVGLSAFYNCQAISKVYIDDIVSWIGINFGNGHSNPLYRSSDDCKLYINNTLTTDLVIPPVNEENEFRVINAQAFRGFKGLNSIVLPKKLKIYNYAFDNNTNLTKVYYSGTQEDWGNSNLVSTFNDSMNSSINTNTRYYYSEAEPTVTGNYWHYVDGVATEWEQLVYTISGEEGSEFVTITGVNNKENMTEIVIPATIEGKPVTTIGANAFKDCKALTSITIPSSIASIGGNAFLSCSNLVNVNITDLNAWLNIDFANFANPLYFNDASSLNLNGTKVENLVISDEFTVIKQKAFRGYKGLKTVVLPQTLTINDGAFNGCSGITAFYYKGSKEDYSGENPKLSIGASNGVINGSTLYFKVDNAAAVPNEAGNYWYYDDGSNIVGVQKFAVTFNLGYDGATDTPEAQVVTKDGKATEPSTPTREGYTFAGWFTASEGGEQFDFNTPITANTTLYAYWTDDTQQTPNT